MENYNSNHNGIGTLSVVDREECLNEALEGLSEDKQAQIRRVVAVAQESSSFNGPLPHPSHFKGYEDVLAGSAERILAMAEKQQEHSFEQERKTHALLYMGLWIALIVVSGAFALVAFAIYRGANSVVYAILGVAAFISVVFALRKIPKSKVIEGDNPTK
ncbi:DUF2335 domain-containing protein [Porphyromonas sp.]